MLEAHLAADDWRARAPEAIDLRAYHHGLGRDLFAVFRANALGAEQGAITFVTPEAAETISSAHAAPVHDHFVFAKEASA